MIKYRQGDDIKLRLRVLNMGKAVDPSSLRWRVRVYTEARDNAVECTHDGNGVYSDNCYVRNGYIVIAIDNPSLVSGYLYVEITLYYEDDDMADGLRTETINVSDVKNLSDSLAEGQVDIKVVGLSAYKVALLNGYDGTEEEWLASLVGPKGDPGNDADIAGCELAISNARMATKDAETATTKATEATTKAIEATSNARMATKDAETATTKATEATTKAIEATSNARTATEDAEMATTKATEATTRAIEATSNARTATEDAETATTKATEATTRATEATSNARMATEDAETATTKATEATTKAIEAAENANVQANYAKTIAAETEERNDYAVDLSGYVDSVKAINYSSLPLLCGQPMILFGNGTPSASVVPVNWMQFDGDTGAGYNWNGTPSAIGQQYINLDADVNGRYIAVRDPNNKYGLIWKNM